MSTVEELRAAQEEEYGTYVAIVPIDVGNARAYNAGDPVPASNVAAHKYDETGQVARRTTKAAARAKQDTSASTA
jgi:hypothetical protein